MDVKGFYTEIGGSYKDALAIMMNDMLISRMLSKFINGDSVPQMISQYEQKDYRALFASAHSLKGVAGNLALSPLYELASIITEATRNSDDVNLDNKISKLKSTYEGIKASYSKYIG